jgi:hypothetical protein
MVGTNHKGKGNKIKLNFLTYKNILIIGGENIYYL